MTRPKRTLFPGAQAHAVQLGWRLRLARRRRGIGADEMAARCGVSKPTVYKLERGDATVSLAVLARYLDVLGLAADLDGIAARDEAGAAIADERLGRPHAKRSRGLADEI
jgi:transcriptional regulator with XRE-family HTH domain